MNTQKKKVMRWAGVLAAAGVALLLGVAVYAIGTAMQVRIDRNGNATLQGTAAWVGQDSISVRSWGGSWTVQTTSATVFSPGMSLSQIQPGDAVTVFGTASRQGAWTIAANRIEDLTPHAGWQPVSITGVSGPMSLQTGQTGTWTIRTAGSASGSVSYSVTWGDERYGGFGGTSYVPQPYFFSQSATFTHAYAAPGTYAPAFFVRAAGTTTSASLTVTVYGGGTGTGSSVPVIQSLVPSAGPTGTVVQITGSGFAAANNIHFGFGGVGNAASSQNGTLLVFRVPASISSCDFYPGCMAVSRLVTPGTYPVFVSNAAGNSNSVTFTVTGPGGGGSGGGPGNLAVRRPGERELNFLVQAIRSDSVSGLLYIKYPITYLYPRPVTLRVGDSVGYACEGETATVTAIDPYNQTVMFRENATQRGQCPL